MNAKQRPARSLRSCLLLASFGLIAALTASAEERDAFIPRLVSSSTVPSTGDVNPYGVAFIPEEFPADGVLKPGDVLVSNFNDSMNTQGKGTTIVLVRPNGVIQPQGNAATFFTSSLPGLSTALGVLRRGFVIVGNVPTMDGTFATLGQGALQIIDRNGKLVATVTDRQFLNGPWDLAIDDDGSLAHIFVSNVGNGTVSRLDATVSSQGVRLTRATTIAHGYTHVANMAALVLGPTGLAFDEESGALFVASTNDNAIYRIANATSTTNSVNRGTLIFSDPHLRGPLALKFAPNGHLLTANGDAVNQDPNHPSEIVEFTKSGEFVREYNVDVGQGGAFGLDVVADRDAAFNYAAVDDVNNSLSVYRLPRDPDR
jgi:DNA-binding beta-propeller fold protein YncE